MGWEQRKISPFTSKTWFHFSSASYQAAVLLSHTGALKKWEGQSRPLFARHLLLINSKPFSFGDWRSQTAGSAFPAGHSPPVLVTAMGRESLSREGTADYAEDEACELNTCGSVCSQVWAPGCKAEEGEELGWNSPWWASWCHRREKRNLHCLN